MKITRPLSLLAACLLAGTAGAQTLTFDVTLSGAQEVPPVNTSGTGQATVTLNLTNGVVSVSGTYSGLNSPRTQQHIHGPAGPGQTAPPIVGLSGTGGTSGTFFGSGLLSSDEMDALLDGRTYINLHSFAHQSGELRGQIPATVGVPAVGAGALAALLAALSAAGAGLVARRRRRSGRASRS